MGLRDCKMVNPIEVQIVVMSQASGRQDADDAALYVLGWGDLWG